MSPNFLDDEGRCRCGLDPDDFTHKKDCFYWNNNQKNLAAKFPEWATHMRRHGWAVLKPPGKDESDKPCRQCNGSGRVARNARDRFLCRDCGQFPGTDFGARDEVWRQAVPDYKYDKDHPFFLCLSCFRKRLGRNLTMEDFKDLPINEGIRAGYVLGLKDGKKGEADGT